MSNQTTAKRHERKISASRLRRFIAAATEDITAGIDTVTLSLSGNTFEIHLEGATINISVDESPEIRKGGAA